MNLTCGLQISACNDVAAKNSSNTISWQETRIHFVSLSIRTSNSLSVKDGKLLDFSVRTIRASPARAIPLSLFSRQYNLRLAFPEYCLKEDQLCSRVGQKYVASPNCVIYRLKRYVLFLVVLDLQFMKQGENKLKNPVRAAHRTSSRLMIYWDPYDNDKKRQIKYFIPVEAVFEHIIWY